MDNHDWIYFLTVAYASVIGTLNACEMRKHTIQFLRSPQIRSRSELTRQSLRSVRCITVDRSQLNYWPETSRASTEADLPVEEIHVQLHVRSPFTVRSGTYDYCDSIFRHRNAQCAFGLA